MKKMLPHHKTVLEALDRITHPCGEHCVGFDPMVRETGMHRAEVRRIVRHLSRRGYAEFWRGLCTDEGELAGSGYCITEAGRRALEDQL